MQVNCLPLVPPFYLHICAGDGDVALTSTRIRVLPNIPLSPVTFTLRVDSISQEMNETFSISFFSLPLSDAGLFPIPPTNIGRLDGTIIDADGKSLR